MTDTKDIKPEKIRDEKLSRPQVAKLSNPSKPGPKPAITDIIIDELERMFRIDATVDMACNHVGIGPATYYRKLADDPEFGRRMSMAKSFTRVAAQNNVAKEIITNKNTQVSQWFLERRAKAEYGRDDASKSINVMGDMNIQNVVEMSQDERQRRIAEIEERIVELEGSPSGGESGE